MSGRENIANSPFAFARHWWLRECGGRALLGMALPLLVSMASWTIMNFMDRMFLSWESEESFAAAMPAGMLQFTFICFPLGVATYVNTFVAQYHGANRPKRIGVAMGQAVRFSLWCTPVFLIGVPLAPFVFHNIGHPADVAPLETIYFQTLTFGAGAAVLSGALSSFFTGLGKTRVVMFVMIATTFLNVVLDWLWIFGKWGFPVMGIAGAGAATALSQWARVGLYWYLIRRYDSDGTYGIVEGNRYDRQMMRRLLKFGAPNGLQMLVECSAISVFLLLLGGLGTQAMAATTLAFNVNSIAFIPLLGLGIAVSTMVGQQLGANKPKLAGTATWTAVHIGLIYSGGMGMLYLFTPDIFFIGHASGIEPGQYAELRDLTVVLLRFVAAYCLFDALNVIFVSAIKGAGDTRFVLWTNFLVSPLPVIAGWIGLHLFDAGLIYCWWVITLWIFLLAIIYLARFLQGKWRDMRVIETDPIAILEEDEAICVDAEFGDEAPAFAGAE